MTPKKPSQAKASPKKAVKKAKLVACSVCEARPGLSDDNTLCPNCEGSGQVKA